MKRILVTTLSSVLALSVSGCTAMEGLLGGPEDEPTAFSTYDENESGLIEQAEFEQGLDDEGVFGAADENDDGLLDDDEFGAGFFESWDVNADGVLEQAEWNDVGFFG